MRFHPVRLFVCFASLLFLSGPVHADVRLPSILSDHAVLQRSLSTNIWGWADPGEKVTVHFDTISSKTVAGADGRWKIFLPLNRVGQGPFEMRVEGRNRLVVSDILVGELWLASGQSNMQFTLNSTDGADEEIERSANPSLRWFMAVSKPQFMEKQEDVAGKWLIAGPETSGDTSGVAYYFGKKIQADLKIPVGLILTAVGGTTIQSWMSESALDREPDLKKEKDLVLAALRDPAKATSVPKKKLKPAMVPTYFYNQLVEPLGPMTMQGFLWYQGEAHYSQGDLYARAFPALIRDWRHAFGQGDLPFYFCQIPNTDEKTSDPGNEGWIAVVREAQDKTLKEPKTGQVVLIDAGGIDTHPTNKKIVGDRLALLAEADTYGQKIVAGGPRYLSCARKGERISIQFSGTEGGLIAAPLPVGETANSSESKIQGFAICGSDKKWVWAQAEIQGDQVEVWSSKVAQPTSIRYAWSNNPTCNLANKEGFPVAPFRADVP